MSAATLGNRMLTGCVKKDLGEVLNSFRLTYSINSGNNSSLSNLFNFDNISTHGAPESPQAFSGRRAPIIELCSEQSGTGKTQLLYLIMATAILPETIADIDIGGRNSAVVILDTESHFNIQRLYQVMKGYIHSKAPEFPDTQITIERSLQHIHVYQPQTLSSLISTLSSLSIYLFDSESHPSTHRPLHSIILDTPSTFYWETRASSENDTVTNPSSTRPNPYATLTHHLHSLARTFHCSIITTTHAFVSTSKETGEQILRTLPAPWSSFPTVRLCFKKDEVRKFSIGTSADEALKERDVRQAVVEEGKFSASLLVGRKVFGFCVSNEGVVIEDN